MLVRISISKDALDELVTEATAAVLQQQSQPELSQIEWVAGGGVVVEWLV
jgi:hypothetical protein